MRKVCNVKQVKIISYLFWRWIRHNYFTSSSFPLNRKWWIISIKNLILYEHSISFTQSLRVLWIYASLRNPELVRKEEALYLRFFTHELKIRKFWISCCGGQKFQTHLTALTTRTLYLQVNFQKKNISKIKRGVGLEWLSHMLKISYIALLDNPWCTSTGLVPVASAPVPQKYFISD